MKVGAAETPLANFSACSFWRGSFGRGFRAGGRPDGATWTISGLASCAQPVDSEVMVEVAEALEADRRCWCLLAAFSASISFLVLLANMAVSLAWNSGFDIAGLPFDGHDDLESPLRVSHRCSRATERCCLRLRTQWRYSEVKMRRRRTRAAELVPAMTAVREEDSSRPVVATATFEGPLSAASVRL